MDGAGLGGSVEAEVWVDIPQKGGGMHYEE